jgi:hypothetical protein
MEKSARPFTMMAILALAVCTVASNFSAAKEKKSTLPAYVLEAQTVFVMIDPDAGTAVNDPQGNQMAREDVEKALMRWGRLKPVMTMSLADLVIVIRKGNTQPVQPTVGGEPTNDRPVIVQATGDTIRIAGQQGRSPDAAEVGGPTGQRPTMGGEVGPAEDLFTVYQGGTDAPALNRPVAWRYARKNGLKSPEVPAVGEFKKVVDEAVKQQQQKQKQQGQSAPATSKP